MYITEGMQALFRKTKKVLKMSLTASQLTDQLLIRNTPYFVISNQDSSRNIQAKQRLPKPIDK